MSRAVNIFDQIQGLLPLGENLIRRLIEAPSEEIDAALDRLELAGSIGRRQCPTTGRSIIVDRRASRVTAHERQNTQTATNGNTATFTLLRSRRAAA